MKKKLLFLGFVILLLIAFEGYLYLNLIVSEKYEVDLIGMPNINYDVMELRKIEIEKNKSRIINEIIILGVFIIILLIFNFFRRNKVDS